MGVTNPPLVCGLACRQIIRQRAALPSLFLVVRLGITQSIQELGLDPDDPKIMFLFQAQGYRGGGDKLIFHICI